MVTLVSAQMPATHQLAPNVSNLPALYVQRQCACGGTPGPDGECEACKAQRLRLQRSPSDRLPASPEKHAARPAGPALPSLANAFGRARIMPQTKLLLSQPGDVYEREADRVADEVTRSFVAGAAPSPVTVSQTLGSPQPAVQRQEDEVVEPDDEGLEGAEFSEEDEEEEIVGDESGMPKREDGAATSSSRFASVRIPTGEGQALGATTRRSMETWMGHDFGHVRIHDDSQAAASARQLRAHAYTVGSNIFFNEGKYEPTRVDGMRLLAHELTHVLQQSAMGPAQGVAGRVQRQPTTQHRRRRSGPDPRRRGRARPPSFPPCAGACAGPLAPLHDGCTSGGPATGGNPITDLTVHRARHNLVVTFTSGPSENWPCSPSTRSGPGGKKEPTPLVTNDHVGIKCDKCHTNSRNAGMGWFTGFASQGRKIGFHNSQRVGASFESHGCVRVSCDHAKTIHDRSSTGTTTVNVVA